MENIVRKPILAATTVAVGAAAAAGSLAGSRTPSAWYSHLRKPTYQPPGAVFPVVWTALYADIAATSAATVERFQETGERTKARNYVAALGINLLLNAGWSWLFFRYHRLGGSAVGAAVLAASSADLVRRSAEADARVGHALLPYLLWCSFATVLSSHIWRLNR